jgi:MFS transporter, MHS family, proline/betaine transporter
MTTSDKPSGGMKVVAASVIGNVLEWYDFAIYGYFATQIGQAFFPHENAVAQLLAAFGIFAVGFLMRPIGGIVIGHVGDRFGRITALNVSIAAMAIPTFLIGILPGYQTLGTLAPIVLVLLRMAQGLSVGGESATAMTFLLEKAPPGHRGFMAAIGSIGALIGMLCGSATGALLSSLMSAETLAAWGWRLPFRRTMQEAPPRRTGERSPLAEVAARHRRLLLRLAGLTAFNAVGFYLVFVYMVSWLQMADGVTPSHALTVGTASLVLDIVVLLGAAWLSDRIGRKPLLLGASGICFVSALPLLWLMYRHDPIFIVLGQTAFVLLQGVSWSVQFSLMVEATPARVRCTLIALGFNLPMGLLGGSAPFVATWLVERTHDFLSPAFLLMAAAAVSFLTVLTFEERYDKPLEAAS